MIDPTDYSSETDDFDDEQKDAGEDQSWSSQQIALAGTVAVILTVGAGCGAYFLCANTKGNATGGGASGGGSTGKVGDETDDPNKDPDSITDQGADHSVTDQAAAEAKKH